MTTRVRNISPSAAALADGKDCDHNWTQPARAAGQPCKFLFYAVDENHRPDKVMRRRLGHNKVKMCVYADPIPDFVSLDDTRSGPIVISAHDHETSECWLIPPMRLKPPICVARRATA